MHTDEVFALLAINLCCPTCTHRDCARHTNRSRKRRIMANSRGTIRKPDGLGYWRRNGPASSDCKKRYVSPPHLSGLLELICTQIMDLESRNAALLAELASPTRASSSSSSSQPFLPRAPARQTLTSHRAPITRVAFHPTWTVLASASEDATVKIWDWESGDFERTVKGHTKAVMDVEYDSKGSLMGM